jgi:hypothetical protein
MAINLTPELEHVVQGIFAGGQYAIETDVIATALYLLQQRDQLRSELQKGCAELDRGERVDAVEVFNDLRRRYSIGT